MELFRYSGVRSQEPGVRMERKPAKDFRDLIVWQKAQQFVLSTYHCIYSEFWLLSSCQPSAETPEQLLF